MDNRSHTRAAVVRFLACTAFALAVAGIAYVCAWREYRAAFYQYNEVYHDLAVFHLDRLRDALDQHHQATGRYPERLADLKLDMRLDEAGELVDPWGRPYQYRVEGDGYTLFSLGRDGQPGGDGLDADLFGQGRQNTYPTLWQFTTDKAPPACK